MLHEVSLNIIKVKPNRQRRKVEGLEDLASSIKQIGQLVPIILDEEHNILAGERRFRAFQLLEKTDTRFAKIKAIYFSELSEGEKQLIEYEENIRREDIDWKEKVMAVYHISELYKKQNFSQAAIAEKLSISAVTLSRYLLLARYLREENKQVKQMATLVSALNFITREEQRNLDDAVTAITHDIAQTFEEDAAIIPLKRKDIDTAIPSVVPKINTKPAQQELQVEYLHTSFQDFAASYKGLPFNLIHCDFPYGIDLDKSEQAGHEYATYEDRDDVYWQLLEDLLKYQDKIIAKSAHILFWFPMQKYTGTLEFWQEQRDYRISPIPLIWHKSDGKGILADAKRYTRHIYETAFFISRGDRLIIQATDDVASFPLGNKKHKSEKNQLMLEKFLKMCIDKNTRLLDPTAGSGNALLAARALGAKYALGLEISKDIYLEHSKRIAEQAARLNIEALDNEDLIDLLNNM